jgi:hypothetical protein
LFLIITPRLQKAAHSSRQMVSFMGSLVARAGSGQIFSGSGRAQASHFGLIFWWAGKITTFIYKLSLSQAWARALLGK